jgi:membrane dipeptidase
MRIEDARAFHAETPVIDLHADTAKLMERVGYDISRRHRPPLPRPVSYVGHVDLPRLKEGGVAAQIFGMWTVPYPRRGCAASVHRQLDALDKAVAAHPEAIRWARTADDIRAAWREGALAAMAGIEGGQALEGKLDNIAAFAARGVRSIGLVHFTKNDLASPAMGVRARGGGGLTEFGREAVREMNRVGVIVDLAHIDRRGFMESLELTSAPAMVTHTGVCGAHRHWRNIDDEQLRALARGGGCAGVIFAPRYLGREGLDAVCEHIEHIIDVAGEDTPALGSDFDGFVRPPRGLEDVSRLPALTAALAARGMREGVLAKLLGENALRVLAAVPPKVAEPRA